MDTATPGDMEPPPPPQEEQPELPDELLSPTVPEPGVEAANRPPPEHPRANPRRNPSGRSEEQGKVISEEVRNYFSSMVTSV
jgi:hypothetical protein